MHIPVLCFCAFLAELLATIVLCPAEAREEHKSPFFLTGILPLSFICSCRFFFCVSILLLFLNIMCMDDTYTPIPSVNPFQHTYFESKKAIDSMRPLWQRLQFVVLSGKAIQLRHESYMPGSKDHARGRSYFCRACAIGLGTFLSSRKTWHASWHSSETGRKKVVRDWCFVLWLGSWLNTRTSSSSVWKHKACCLILFEHIFV